MGPHTLIFLMAAVFMVVERAFPGRALPASHGWYFRAVLLNGAQLGIVLLGGVTWSVWFQGPSLLHIGDVFHPVLQGFVAWFVGTFVFYWSHRARHSVDLFWRVFHQMIHHSASRIELVTSF